jgi:hypothetical protein
LVSDFIRDEVPKAPVMLYSLKNQNKFNEEDRATMSQAEYESERTVKDEMMKGLEDLNQSLWLSELSEEVNLVIPFDTPVFGENSLLSQENYSQSSHF